MELWVRSQDKETLMKVNHLDIDESNNIIEYNNLIFLGHYNTFERALEVLDEIHQRLIDLQTLETLQDSSFTKRNLNCVYQMPSK